MDSGLKIFNSTLITSQDSGWYKSLNLGALFPLDLEGLLAEIFIGPLINVSNVKI